MLRKPNAGEPEVDGLRPLPTRGKSCTSDGIETAEDARLGQMGDRRIRAELIFQSPVAGRQLCRTEHDRERLAVVVENFSQLRFIPWRGSGRDAIEQLRRRLVG